MCTIDIVFQIAYCLWRRIELCSSGWALNFNSQVEIYTVRLLVEDVLLLWFDVIIIVSSGGVEDAVSVNHKLFHW